MPEQPAQSQIVMQFDQLPPSNNQLLRMHWRRRKQLLDAWIFHVKTQAQELNLPAERPAWRMRVQANFLVYRLMDDDNAEARFKLIGDALVKAGLLLDDNSAALQLEVLQSKVARNDQKTVLRIDVLEPGDEFSYEEWVQRQRNQQAGVRKRQAQRGW